MSSGAAAIPARRKSTTAKHASSSADLTVSSTPEVLPVEVLPVGVLPVESPIAGSHIEISNQAVARLAFTYYAGRGYQGGSPEEDWLRAEQELRAVTASK